MSVQSPNPIVTKSGAPRSPWTGLLQSIGREVAKARTADCNVVARHGGMLHHHETGRQMLSRAEAQGCLLAADRFAAYPAKLSRESADSLEY